MASVRGCAPSCPHSVPNTRVRAGDDLGRCNPIRRSAGRSVSAGPSISTRLPPIRRRRARRQPLASASALPRSMTASKASAPVMAAPPSSPKLTCTALTCSASSTRPMRATPSSDVSRRTRMFSAGRRSQMGSSRPEASQKRESRWLGSSPISCFQSMRQWPSSVLRPV